mmetsp:Transcript_51392/g.144814  ORF Transcript_51392/g.144814 Transcript_51392/m.144814 type:complete len:230 (+) Transcript_51392:802-1491(+)
MTDGAAAAARSKTWRTPASEAPMYFESNSGPLTVMNRRRPFVSLAAAWTSIVFPQPGGPTSMSPLLVRIGARSMRMAYFVGVVSMSSSSCLVRLSPPTSDHCTLDAKNVWSVIVAGTKPWHARSRCRCARRRLSCQAGPAPPWKRPALASTVASTQAQATSLARSATLKPSTRPPHSSSAPSFKSASSTSHTASAFSWQKICRISGRSFSCGDRSGTLCSIAGRRRSVR